MANVLPLIILPNPLLRQRSKPLTAAEISDPKTLQLISDMYETMKVNNGVGLAAVQVGTLKRITVIETKDGMLPLLNPVIVHHSWRKQEGEEGCLSIPGTYGLVKRASKIKVEALNQQGQVLHFTAEGFFARVIQHEIDHMDGVLFIDRTKKVINDEPAYRKKIRDANKER